MRGDIELMGGPPSPPTRENLGCLEKMGKSSFIFILFLSSVKS